MDIWGSWRELQRPQVSRWFPTCLHGSFVLLFLMFVYFVRTTERINLKNKKEQTIVESLNLFVIVGGNIFRTILEDGIYKSKITLLFWSKSFEKDRFCLYQSDLALKRVIQQSECHILIPVLLDSCKILKQYEQLGCVDARMWQEDPTKAFQNVLKSARGMFIFSLTEHRLETEQKYLSKIEYNACR